MLSSSTLPLLSSSSSLHYRSKLIIKLSNNNNINSNNNNINNNNNDMNNKSCYRNSEFIEEKLEEDNGDNHTETPLRYASLEWVYFTAASLCASASGSSSVMSKKVKAHKLTAAMVSNFDEDNGEDDPDSLLAHGGRRQHSPQKRAVVGDDGGGVRSTEKRAAVGDDGGGMRSVEKRAVAGYDSGGVLLLVKKIQSVKVLK